MPRETSAGAGASARPRTWQEMRERIERQLERTTGEGLAAWNGRVRDLGDGIDEAALRRWLSDQGVTGYPQNLLVMERFGYPDFLLASSDELLDAQYADREQLRPVLDAVLALVPRIAGDVSVQVRKTYVTLVGPRRTFALVRASTRDRVDLGLRLEMPADAGGLLPARGLGQDWATVRIALRSTADVDASVLGWLQRTYDANA